MPRVTVIVPCHDGGRFLDGLLASLAGQTFRDFDTIIVNNGSTETLTLSKLAELENDVRVVHQENRYLPGARNRGFLEAKTEFVLPIDCDDTLEPSYLAEAVPMLERAPADVGFVFSHMRLSGMLAGVLPCYLNPFDQLFFNRLPCCMLIRRSAWRAVGGYDETFRDGAEDWEFNIRLWRSGIRGLELAKPLFVYAVRPGGMLISYAARMHGTNWRRIRTKHADLYRISALARLWRATRMMPSKLSGGMAAALLLSAKLVPDALFNRMFYWLLAKVRERRIGRGDFSAVSLTTGGITSPPKAR